MKTAMRSHAFRVLLVLVALALVLGACGGGEEQPADGGGGAQEPEFETLQEGTLLVGSCLDYKPFEYRQGGELKGFDVELVEAIADNLGLQVEWKKADFDTIFTALDAGQFDMVAAASTITEEREQVVDFSDPYFTARQSLSVNTEETPDIQSTDDLSEGDVVGVQKGTTGKDWAEENLADAGVQIKTYTAAPDAFTDLEAGQITAVVNDEGSSVAEVKGRAGLEVVEAIDTDENYGFPFNKDNPELREAVNGALEDVIADGTYEEIFKKYFPDQEVPPEFQAS